MKIKNLLVQWLIMTPLSLIQTVFGIGIIMCFTNAEFQEEMMGSMGGVGIFIMPLMIIGICFLISKLLLRIKGKAVDYTYWDSNFEYELENDYGDHYTARKTKGGWTTGTKLIVWAYVAMSPVTFFLQLVSNVFALIAFFNKRIASWYGGINYDTLDNPKLQNVLHFLFNFVILNEGYVLGK